MRWMRRTRGALLRIVRNRRWALVGGLLLTLPGGWLALGEYGWENWATDALSFFLLATGLALLLASLGGVGPDWIDPDDRS